MLGDFNINGDLMQSDFAPLRRSFTAAQRVVFALGRPRLLVGAELHGCLGTSIVE